MANYDGGIWRDNSGGAHSDWGSAESANQSMMGGSSSSGIMSGVFGGGKKKKPPKPKRKLIPEEKALRNIRDFEDALDYVAKSRKCRQQGKYADAITYLNIGIDRLDTVNLFITLM